MNLPRCLRVSGFDYHHAAFVLPRQWSFGVSAVHVRHERKGEDDEKRLRSSVELILIQLGNLSLVSCASVSLIRNVLFKSFPFLTRSECPAEIPPIA